MTEHAPAGWFQTAPNSAEQRYWTGTEWSDFYYPPRPGQQLTAEQAAERAAAEVPSPDSQSPESSPVRPSRPRRRRVVIIAAALALVVAVAAVIVAVNGRGAGVDSSKLVNGYAYLPAIHVTPTQRITLPAQYDFTAKVHSLNPRGDSIDGSYTDKVLAVYTNAEFTSDAQTYIAGDGKNVVIYPAEDNAAGFAETSSNAKAFGDGSTSSLIGSTTYLNRPHAKESYKSWGLFDTYYIVQHYSGTGQKLKHPTVTPVIPSGNKLHTPRVRVAPTKGDIGSITFNWNKIKGATEYVILSYSNTVGVRQIVSVEGTVPASETTWNSSSSDHTTTYLGLNVALEQNVGLETYGSFSADDEQSGYFNLSATNHMLYGVMALSGTRSDSGTAGKYSAMGTVDSAIAAALPADYAHNAQNKAFTGQVYTSIDQLPLLFPYTSLDGATRQTRGILKVGFAPLVHGTYNLMMQGVGVNLGIGVRLDASIEPNAFIAAYNAKSLAAAPKTGLSSLPVLAATVTSGGSGPVSHSAPDLGYPVSGSDEFTRYLAANLIAHKGAVDISKFSTTNISAVLFEAELQNPYIFDLTGYGLSPDGTTIYFSYGFDAAETTKLQHDVKAKVKSVVASVTTPSMSAAAKVTALNNWVTAHVTYDNAALAASSATFTIGLSGYPKGFESAWDPDGALLKGSAVCGGYAAAFDLLANAAGVRTIVVTGNVLVGGRHAWNKVEIDGGWKDVDSTWNDDRTKPNQYLLINDNQFTGPATRSEDGIWMPVQAQAKYETDK